MKNNGQVADAWKFLGSKGDAYAFLAGEIVSNNTLVMSPVARLFYEMVRSQWENTVGAGVWGGTVFLGVGKVHLENYLKLLNDSPAATGGYTLPSTEKIEASYKAALNQYGLPPITAIDSLFSVLDYNAGNGSGEAPQDFSWAQIMWANLGTHHEFLRKGWQSTRPVAVERPANHGVREASDPFHSNDHDCVGPNSATPGSVDYLPPAGGVCRWSAGHRPCPRPIRLGGVSVLGGEDFAAGRSAIPSRGLRKIACRRDRPRQRRTRRAKRAVGAVFSRARDRHLQDRLFRAPGSFGQFRRPAGTHQ